ncbi:MAG: lysine 2,3-aminomutase, partial [Desulfobacterales bacterium]|nr:lysine 2,3-aminomutase [Desulfobacterales bacterium]
LEMIREDACLTDSIVTTGIPDLYRQHETRVELTTAAGKAAIDYIQADKRITDVIISDENDAVTALGDVQRIVNSLASIAHVNAVRLRSLFFNHAPEQYTRAVIDRLAAMNRLSIVGPLRLEIETRFYHAGEISSAHHGVVRALNNRGIAVYNNTPLIAGVNDKAETIQAL